MFMLGLFGRLGDERGGWAWGVGVGTGGLVGLVLERVLGHGVVVDGQFNLVTPF